MDEDLKYIFCIGKLVKDKEYFNYKSMYRNIFRRLVFIFGFIFICVIFLFKGNFLYFLKNFIFCICKIDI